MAQPTMRRLQASRTTVRDRGSGKRSSFVVLDGCLVVGRRARGKLFDANASRGDAPPRVPMAFIVGQHLARSAKRVVAASIGYTALRRLVLGGKDPRLRCRLRSGGGSVEIFAP